MLAYFARKIPMSHTIFHEFCRVFKSIAILLPVPHNSMLKSLLEIIVVFKVKLEKPIPEKTRGISSENLSKRHLYVT